jgi:hypothetical protein
MLWKGWQDENDRIHFQFYTPIECWMVFAYCGFVGDICRAGKCGCDCFAFALRKSS